MNHTKQRPNDPAVPSSRWLGVPSFVLFVSCVFNGVGWAYGIEYPQAFFGVAPVREEPRSMGIVGSVGIANEAKERDALVPSHNTCDLGLVEGDFHLPLMFPVGGQDKLCKDIRLFVGGLLIRDGKFSYGPTDVYPCQKGGTSTNIRSEPFESKWEGLYVARRPTFWVVGNNHNPRSFMLKRNIGLPPYLFPLSPSKHYVGDRSRDDRELCNDGKGFITGHWVLGIILCALGMWCSCRMYLMPDGLSDHSYFIGALIWQGLFILFFGIGCYGVISSTFKDCDMKPNAL